MRKIFLLAIGLLFWGNIAGAASYDFYVDDSCGDEREGSEDKPFCDIADALEKAGSGDKIYVKDGTYKENVSLPKGVELFGKSENRVVIQGYVEMADKTKLENLTVSGSNFNVRIKKDADAEIDGCTIKEAKRVGIQTEIGGGKLQIKNSKIRDGARGIYVQEGKTIEISGNEIYDNAEEGLDIRARVKGDISNNSIYGNGESGIELIVGKSELSIKSNSIKNNGSSGIANQFYAQWSKEGKIIINSNTLSGNKKFGIDCNIPSAGADQMKPGYWSDSIDLRKNKIEKNSQGPVNDYCSLIKVVEEEEKKDNEIVAEGQSEEISDGSGTETSNQNPSEKSGELSEEDKRIELEIGKFKEDVILKERRLEEIRNYLESRLGWQKFFWGNDPRLIREVKEIMENMRESERFLENNLENTGNPDLVENLNRTREEIKGKNEDWERIFEEIEDSFSIFGWLRKLSFRLLGD